MDDQGESRTEHATTTMLRAAGAAYRGSVQAELHEAGIDDLPRNGAAVLARIATDQAVSDVDDILVRRGYVVGGPSPELTERGQAAAEAVLRGVAEVDSQLAERIGAEKVEVMRDALGALAEIGLADRVSSPSRFRRAGRELRRFCPIFPVRDLRAALAHYAALGFRTEPYADGDFYGFANREGVGLHLHESTYYGDRAAAYLYVRDADALYAEWSVIAGGSTDEVHTTDYGMREGAHTDPDGNVIRFGSDIAD